MDVYNKPKICYFNKLLKYTGDVKNNQEDIKLEWLFTNIDQQLASQYQNHLKFWDIYQ